MIFRRLATFLWWCFVIVVVSLAVSLSAARLLLPAMAEYRLQIEALASDLVERTVRIGSLDAAWQGLSPVLKLQQVSVHGDEFPGGTLDVHEVDLALDLVGSVLRRQWLTSQIKVVGTHLSFTADGGGGQDGAGRADPLAWLLAQKSIALENVSVEWADQRRFAEPLQFTDISLQLINDGQRHHVSLQTRLAQYPDSHLHLVADLSGPGDRPAAWRGRLYLNAQALVPAVAQGFLDELGIAVSGSVDLELWAGIDAGRLDWGAGALLARQAGVRKVDDDAGGFSADRFGSKFRWQAIAGGWQLDLSELGYARGSDEVWPASTVSVAIEQDETLRLRGKASTVVIDEISPLLPLLPWVDADALIMVDRLQLAGQLHDAEFEAEFPEGVAPRVAVRARFNELAMEASSGLPGVTGMSGSIEGNLQSGRLNLDSSDSSLSMPGLFDQDLQLSQLAGTLSWQRYADSFRVRGQQLQARSGALAVNARLQLDWPYRRSSPWIDLQVASDALPLEQVRNYLPDKVMKPKAIAWLREAFDAGTARNVRFLLQGYVDQIPFDRQQGRLEARFDFEDVLLDYHPQWGQLHELHGSALFEGRSMKITGSRGYVAASPLRRVTATIADFKKPVLNIDGAVSSTLPGLLDYVVGSPLGKRFGAAIEQFDSGGAAQLQLALRIPLKRGLGKVAVRGDVALSGNTLAQKIGVVAFSDIHGKLQFTHTGVSARRLDAQLLNNPVTVAVYQKQEAARSDTVVDVSGPMDLVGVLRAKQPALARYFDGVSNWHALVQIPAQPAAGDPDYQLQLQSDLVGIDIDLPEPFHKDSGKARKLLINWAADRGSSQPVLVSYGDLIDARILPTADRDGIRKADVRFGSGTAQLPEQREIRLAGQLQQLDLDAWLAIIRAQTDARQSAAQAAPTLPPVSAHLALMNLSMFGHQVKDVRVDSESAKPWNFTLQGEGAAGQVRWSPAESDRAPALQLALDHLVLRRGYGVFAESAGQRLSRPQALPELLIDIAALRKDGTNFGALGLRGRPIAEGYEFDSVSLKSAAIDLAGKGSWLQHGERQSSGVEARINAGKLEKLARLFGKSSAVQGGSLTGELTLNWSGSPAAFSIEALEGEVQIKALDGRLEKVDEGAGKLLNLFSLNSLQRRLSLDFSDIVKEGFSFDTMEGRIVLTDGDAFTSDFTIAGSSAIISIAGRTGLVNKDYDQLVTVTPQVSSSLPIAGAIAGGPAVGAAVFLAEKLVGKEFNRMTEVQYQVSGSWDKPVYEKLQKNQQSADTAANGG